MHILPRNLTVAALAAALALVPTVAVSAAPAMNDFAPGFAVWSLVSDLFAKLGSYMDPDGGKLGSYMDPDGDKLGSYMDPDGDKLGSYMDPDGDKLGSYMDPDGGKLGSYMDPDGDRVSATARGDRHPPRPRQ